MPAQLAPEGINVKKTHQTFKTVPSGCSSDIVAGTLGTMNLSADLRSHSGRKIARNRDESKGLARPQFFLAPWSSPVICVTNVQTGRAENG